MEDFFKFCYLLKKVKTLTKLSEHAGKVRKNIMYETWVHSNLNGFDIKIPGKSIAIENIFKSWGLFGIYQLISTANPAQFYSKKGQIGSAD